MIVRSMLLFALAGFAEIAGGYLMWLWLREHRPLWPHRGSQDRPATEAHLQTRSSRHHERRQPVRGDDFHGSEPPRSKSVDSVPASLVDPR